MKRYVAVYTESFRKCVKKYRPRKAQVQAIEERILTSPYAGSHRLGKKGRVDLRGKRSRHDAGGTYAFVFAICEECVKEGLEDFNDCAGCETIPENAVVFFAYGRHDDVYAREWHARSARDSAAP